MRFFSLIVVFGGLIFIVGEDPAAAQFAIGTAKDITAQAQASASASAGAPGAKYGPQDALDNNPDTWWAAYNKLPVTYELRFPQAQTFDTIVLVNANNPALYSHIKRLVISFGDGTQQEEELPNERGPFIIRFPARATDTIRLTITQAYEAEKVYVGLATIGVYHDPQKQVRIKVSPQQMWKNIDLTEQGRAEHPCVYLTREDVQRARERIKKEPWAADYARRIISLADAALARSNDWYLQHLPEKGACFAYGITGCPICRASWGTWGGARCSWDKPRKVTCANGHELPDAEHPDPGTGYKGPDGRIHYFIGSWNAWVTEKYIHEMAGPCAIAYSLTGEEKYAEKAGFILDAIASIYPYCDKGSWDYPSDPPSGRLARPWYQVARVLVRLVDFYDQIYPSSSLDQPSIVAGLTRRQNIEQNMLKNGAAYCYEHSLAGGLNNGTADYIRGALAVGCLLGIESYVEWAYTGPYGILALVHNNVCRDGRYYETSVMYADHTRELYLSFAEPLWNYRSPKYPQGINIYTDPVFQSFYLIPAASIAQLGHSPRFGDSAPDVSRIAPPKVPNYPLDQYFAEVLYARSTGQAQDDFGALLNYLTQGNVAQARANAINQEWLLFHAVPAEKISAAADTKDSRTISELRPPDWLLQRIHATGFFGQKGLVFLRTPIGPLAQAALIRFGPSLNHGHLDDLNLNYYALGYELTYDLGYSFGSTHTQVGWARQTASHNLVLVDEKPQGPDNKVDGSGGSLHLVASLPGLQVTECSAEPTYKSLGVTEYRRLCALVGEGPDTYLVDIFNVTGGKQHDYIFHALSKTVDFAGVTLGAPESGSLAGPDIRWGALQGNDGDIIGFPNKPYWNPPPGNGLGFLMEPQRAPLSGPFTATWHIGAASDDCHLRMTGLPELPTELITAWAPGIYPETTGAYSAPSGFPRSRYVYLRRKSEQAPLKSTFVALYEPYTKPPVEGKRELEELLAAAQATGGEIKPIPQYRLLLFKATGPQDELRLRLKVPQTGDYVLGAGVYGSPNYGVAQLSLDGEALQPLLNEPGTVPLNSTGHFNFGKKNLRAGEHSFVIKVLKPQGENYWIGLQYISLTPAAQAVAIDAPAQPFIKRVERLEAPAEAVVIRVEHLNGLIDYLIYNRPVGRRISVQKGEIVTDGYFTQLRFRGQTLLQANAVGASYVQAGSQKFTIGSNWRGTISQIDYKRNKVYTTASLPTDGHLRGLPIYFSHPDYSRNTVYRLQDVTRQGGQTVLDLGRTSLLLGFAELDDEPLDSHTLTTLTPHEYSRALGRPDSHFFHGKMLATEDQKIKTTIHATLFGQPFKITVDSVEGFRQGMRVYYYDIKPGDEFVIYNHWAWRK